MQAATRLALPATVLVLLLAACPVLAQPGPAPGQEPVDYARAYAERQVAEAQEDPGAFVKRTASVEGVGRTVGEAGYVACWQAYEATQQHLEAACGGFFTPPGASVGEPPATNATADEGVAGEAVAEAEKLAGTAADAAGEIVEDPTSAPSQVERVLAAAGQFVGWLADAVVGLVQGLLTGIGALGLALGQGIAAGVGALGEGLAAFGSLLGDAGVAFADGAGAMGLAVADASVAAWDALGDGLAALGSGLAAIGSGLAALGSGLATAGQAALDGIVVAGHAVADGVATAVRAVSDGVVAAVEAAADAIGSLFSADEASQERPSGGLPVDVKAPETTATGILDEVTERLPA
jgi:hypothetical protein